MVEFCIKRLNWLVRLELLVSVELSEDEAEMADPLKKEFVLTVELMCRGVVWCISGVNEALLLEERELREDELKD